MSLVEKKIKRYLILLQN